MTTIGIAGRGVVGNRASGGAESESGRGAELEGQTAAGGGAESERGSGAARGSGAELEGPAAAFCAVCDPPPPPGRETRGDSAPLVAAQAVETAAVGMVTAHAPCCQLRPGEPPGRERLQPEQPPDREQLQPEQLSEPERPPSSPCPPEREQLQPGQPPEREQLQPEQPSEREQLQPEQLSEPERPPSSPCQPERPVPRHPGKALSRQPGPSFWQSQHGPRRKLPFLCSAEPGQPPPGEQWQEPEQLVEAVQPPEPPHLPERKQLLSFQLLTCGAYLSSSAAFW